MSLTIFAKKSPSKREVFIRLFETFESNLMKFWAFFCNIINGG